MHVVQCCQILVQHSTSITNIFNEKKTEKSIIWFVILFSITLGYNKFSFSLAPSSVKFHYSFRTVYQNNAHFPFIPGDFRFISTLFLVTAGYLWFIHTHFRFISGNFRFISGYYWFIPTHCRLISGHFRSTSVQFPFHFPSTSGQLKLTSGSLPVNSGLLPVAWRHH